MFRFQRAIEKLELQQTILVPGLKLSAIGKKINSSETGQEKLGARSCHAPAVHLK